MLPFKQHRLNESYQKQTRAEAAHGYLSGISSYFKSSATTHQERMLEEQKQGHIDPSMDKEHIERYASQCGMIDACNAMLNNPPSYEVFDHFNQQMLDAADERGDTFTKGYGDMRSYNRAGAAKARADNTGIKHAAFVNLYNKPSSRATIQHHISTTSNKSSVASSFDSRPDNASSDKYNAMFQYNANVPRNIALPQSLTPPDVVELREAVEGEMLFGDRSDTARNKKLQILSDDLHMKELAKQTKTKLTVLRKKNITPVEKIDLLLNQIQLDN